MFLSLVGVSKIYIGGNANTLCYTRARNTQTKTCLKRIPRTKIPISHLGNESSIYVKISWTEYRNIKQYKDNVEINFHLDFSKPKLWVDVLLQFDRKNEIIRHKFDSFYTNVILNNLNIFSTKEHYHLNVKYFDISNDILLYFHFSNTTNENEAEHINIEIQIVSDYDAGSYSVTDLRYNVRKQIWRKVVTLFRRQPDYLISLKGIIKIVSATNIGFSANGTMSVYILDKNLYNYQQGFLTSALEPSVRCFLRHRTYCYKSVQFRHKNYSNLQIKKIWMGIRESPKRVKGSWTKALQWCQSLGGTLPILTSKEEETELIGQLKLAEDAPPSHILFIGLVINKVKFHSLVHLLCSNSNIFTRKFWGSACVCFPKVELICISLQYELVSLATNPSYIGIFSFS